MAVNPSEFHVDFAGWGSLPNVSHTAYCGMTTGHRAAKGQEDDDGRNLYRADNTAWLGGLRMSSTGDTNDATQSMII